MRRPTTAITAVATVLGVLFYLLAASSPAHAYGRLFILYASVDTDNCDTIDGTLLVFPGPLSDQCEVVYSDGSSGFFFQDEDAVAIAIDISTTSRRVALIEFHPYDELFYILDLADDGDTIYVEFLVEGDGGGFFDLVGVFRPPGTSAEVDELFRDLSLPDLRQVVLCVYDDASLAELIVCASGVA